MKNIALILMLNMVALSDFAQNIDLREKLMVGLKAGVNFSNVYDTHGEEFTADPKFGFAGGGFLTIPIGKFLGVQPEVLLSQKGFTGSGRLAGSAYEFTRTTTYLDFPLLISFKPSSFLSLVAGPQYSFLINQKDDYNNGVYNYFQEQEFKNDNIRRNTLGFLGGADVNINHIAVGLRMGWDILNNKGDGTSNTPRYKNVWYQLTLGLRL